MPRRHPRRRAPRSIHLLPALIAAALALTTSAPAVAARQHHRDTVTITRDSAGIPHVARRIALDVRLGPPRL